MSTIDPVPSTGNVAATSSKIKSEIKENEQWEERSTIAISFVKKVMLLIKKCVLDTLGPLLVIIRVTIIFIFALLADTLIIAIINWSFGGIINHILLAAKLLEGIQLLSALGTAVAYILYLIRSLLTDAKHAWKEIGTEVDRS